MSGYLIAKKETINGVDQLLLTDADGQLKVLAALEAGSIIANVCPTQKAQLLCQAKTYTAGAAGLAEALLGVYADLQGLSNCRAYLDISASAGDDGTATLTLYRTMIPSAAVPFGANTVSAGTLTAVTVVVVFTAGQRRYIAFDIPGGGGDYITFGVALANDFANGDVVTINSFYITGDTPVGSV